MRQRARLFACAAFFCVASVAVGQTVVYSGFVGQSTFRDAGLYSNAANWSPAEVPNNSSSKLYDVFVSFNNVNLDMDATVENLTLSFGTGFSSNGYSYAVLETTSVVGYLEVSGPFSIKGSLWEFDSANKTLSGGQYVLFSRDGSVGSLSFPGADIVYNGASISLQGAASTITDAVGRDALRNFAHNNVGASFGVVARDYTIANAFTNDGLLTVGIAAEQQYPPVGASLTIANLTNYDRQSNRLAGGSYDIMATSGTASGVPPVAPAQLIVAGADIVRNAASITLEVTGSGELVSNPTITDENGNDALRHFAENEPAGFLQLNYLTQPFQTNSDLTNEGSVRLQMSSLGVPAGHVYRQTGGGTILSGGSIIGDVELSGGELFAFEGLNQSNTVSATSAISGNLTVGDALLIPGALTVNGSVLLSDTSNFFVGYGPSIKGLTAQSTLSLGGTLEILYGELGTIAHAGTISGTFKNAPNGSRVFRTTGEGSYVVTYTSTDVMLSDYQPATATPRLLNISTRAQVLTGNNVAIGGFIVSGSDYKNVVIRAIGPELAVAGVAGALQDPVIELHDSKGVLIETNDNWQDTQRSVISSTGLDPRDARESAIFAALAPGAYTVVVRGKNDTTGVALVEVYDLSSGSASKLANISTRGFVDADHVLIGGVIIGGNAQDKVQVVVRAIGAGLQASGVQDFLADPAFEVRDQSGNQLAANDDFGSPSTNLDTVPKDLRPSMSADSATGITLPTGNYTVVVHGKNGASGNALVEIYDLNP